MPRIEHAALWTRDLEALRAFYERYFGGKAGERYTNPRTGFSSYFVAFEAGARLEIMTAPDVGVASRKGDTIGLAHLAFSVGSAAAVDALTETLRAAGCTVAGEPRRTGDGYYESVILDPDGNRIEITI